MHEKKPGTSRWLISYADFITLLFAFFVVMYAVSSLNEGKYKVFSDSLESAFRDPARTLDLIQVGELAKMLSQLVSTEGEQFPINTTVHNPRDADLFSKELPLGVLKKEMAQKFSGFVRDKIINFRDKQNWLELEINSNLLFNVGGSYLSRDAEVIIKELAKLLNMFDNPLTIEGYTDNVPIANGVFPSNWELSADRAAAVARILIANGVDPRRIAVAGYGEYYPKASNMTEGGRAINRRVVILIERDNKRREELLADSASFNADDADSNDLTDEAPLYDANPEIIIKNKKSTQPQESQAQKAIASDTATNTEENR